MEERAPPGSDPSGLGRGVGVDLGGSGRLLHPPPDTILCRHLLESSPTFSAFMLTELESDAAERQQDTVGWALAADSKGAAAKLDSASLWLREPLGASTSSVGKWTP